jgi:hypothetical protein
MRSNPCAFSGRHFPFSLYFVDLNHLFLPTIQVLTRNPGYYPRRFPIRQFDHPVTITNYYEIMLTDVTVAQYMEYSTQPWGMAQ